MYNIINKFHFSLLCLYLFYFFFDMSRLQVTTGELMEILEFFCGFSFGAFLFWRLFWLRFLIFLNF
nr:MAG TPA: hypothetical protein [Caudoviricetes sp.]